MTDKIERAATKVERDQEAVEFYERRATDQPNADNLVELQVAERTLADDIARLDDVESED